MTGKIKAACWSTGQIIFTSKACPNGTREIARGDLLCKRVRKFAFNGSTGPVVLGVSIAKTPLAKLRALREFINWVLTNKTTAERQQPTPLFKQKAS